MLQLIRKVSYTNKQKYAEDSIPRSIVVTTVVECSNKRKAIVLKNLTVKIIFANQEYYVQLEGIKQFFTSSVELENGIELFKHFKIVKISINKSFDNFSIESVKLSKCLINIRPSCDVLTNSTSEQIIFSPYLLDKYSFKFEEDLNTVTISGLQSIENYQTFIRSLLYKNNLNLTQNKKFFIICFQSNSSIETNKVLIQLNLIKSYLNRNIFELKTTNEKLVTIFSVGKEVITEYKITASKKNSELKA